MKRALRYACDNSLSPMETDIAETMVFDPRMGGLGLEKPQLNPRFEVTRKNRRALPQSAYLPDLFWPRANISVEYDSDKHHRCTSEHESIHLPVSYTHLEEGEADGEEKEKKKRRRRRKKRFDRSKPSKSEKASSDKEKVSK